MMSNIPRYIVKVNGETYGAYMTQEDADEIVARLEKKGQPNVTIGNRATDWVWPMDRDENANKIEVKEENG